MENWINKMERRFGKYAIRNLTQYIIAMYVAGYLMQAFAGKVLINYLTLDIYQISRGQIWRLVTWLFMPPTSMSIWIIFMLLLYYWLGTTLERQWGTFRYNLYIFSGMLFTILGAVITYFILKAQFVASGYPAASFADFSAVYARQYTTFYINMTIFFAFAAMFPNERLYLYFIIPVKIKWLAYVDAAFLLLSFIKGPLPLKINIIASVLNFILFFVASRNISPKRYVGNMQRKKKAKKMTPHPKVTTHKCYICGRTEKDDPDLEFRFCSKCDGNYEYCSDHLFTHVHIKKEDK